MNRPIYASMLIGLALLGCGTTQLSKDLKPYVGKDLRELVKHLGRPNGELEETGDPVYVWLADTDGVLPGSPTASSTGDGSAGTYLGSRTGAALMSVEYQCRLEVTTDAHGVIQRYEIEGSAIGCKQLRKVLNH